jgi:hypothetical protein
VADFPSRLVVVLDGHALLRDRQRHGDWLINRD